MENLAIAAALEAVYMAPARNRSSESRAAFVTMLKWAYRAQSERRAIRAFMREVNAGCYAFYFPR